VDFYSKTITVMHPRPAFISTGGLTILNI